MLRRKRRKRLRWLYFIGAWGPFRAKSKTANYATPGSPLRLIVVRAQMGVSSVLSVLESWIKKRAAKRYGRRRVRWTRRNEEKKRAKSWMVPFDMGPRI